MSRCGYRLTCQIVTESDLGSLRQAWMGEVRHCFFSLVWGSHLEQLTTVHA